ncbi:MAG: amidohydrolase [Novosphingobium sp.]|nr:amidohydrolase [Novosphingobium sp.]
MAQAPADTIFTGSHIITMDGSKPQAVALRGETIAATGSRATVMKLAGPDTRVVELGDKALVPGFIDSHSHVTMVGRMSGYANLSSPPVGPVTDIASLQQRLRDHIAAKALPEGAWVMGYGYDDSLLAENRHPTREDLDAVSTTRPIAILHVSGHLSVANSAALAAAGITAQSKDPPGGHIRRKAGSDEPDGVLEETAAYSVLGKVYGSGPASPMPGILAALDTYASEGFTTVQDGASNAGDIAAITGYIEKSGKPLPVDLVAFPTFANLPAEAKPTCSVPVTRTYTGGFRIGGTKFVLDGSPQGRTAWLSKPYTLPPEGKGADYVAYPTVEPSHFMLDVTNCIAAKVPVLAHANGDAAIQLLIDAVGSAIGEAKVDHRTVIIHAQLMTEMQLDQAKALGLIPSFYAVHPYFWGDWHRKIFGEERASRISPMHSAVVRGLPFTIHNDAPVVPPMALRLMSIAVNRTTRSGYVLGPDQRATPYEALQALTINGARQYFEEASKGSITQGKQADLVILDADPLQIDPAKIADIKVIETISRGKTVYRKD